MTETEMAPARRRQKWIVVLLAALFAAPAILAWLLFHYTQVGRGGGDGTSHGHLVQPPRQLPDLPLADPAGDGGTAKLYGKWSLVYLVDGECGRRCEQNLYRLRQIRLAQGRHADRVQRVLIDVGPGHVGLSSRQRHEYAGQLLADPDQPGRLLEQFRLSDGDLPLAAGRTYIVDPRGFLMMSYAADTDPGGIIDDLKRLLRYSGVG
jgi:cytochrome oxidase Cu insertion factor (SCO1/SenC/PrrC family)